MQRPQRHSTATLLATAILCVAGALLLRASRAEELTPSPTAKTADVNAATAPAPAAALPPASLSRPAAPSASSLAAAVHVPQPPTGLPEDTHLDKTPPRQTTGLNLVKMGWSYDCMECHRALDSKWHRDKPLVEHENIHLDHGNNRFCLNCHHPTNRNVFVDYDGSEIPEKDVVLLCAKCHGPVYRDWEAGAHGRLNGYWDTDKGPQTRLRCIQCHDPHSPVFKPLHPLPPPSNPKHAPGGSHGGAASGDTAPAPSHHAGTDPTGEPVAKADSHAHDVTR